MTRRFMLRPILMIALTIVVSWGGVSDLADKRLVDLQGIDRGASSGSSSWNSQCRNHQPQLYALALSSCKTDSTTQRASLTPFRFNSSSSELDRGRSPRGLQTSPPKGLLSELYAETFTAIVGPGMWCVCPEPRLLARFTQNPFTHGQNRPHSSATGINWRRRDLVPSGVGPAYQCFSAGNFTCPQIDLRLVVQHKFSPFQG